MSVFFCFDFFNLYENIQGIFHDIVAYKDHNSQKVIKFNEWPVVIVFNKGTRGKMRPQISDYNT
jgi:hypothetical protein